LASPLSILANLHRDYKRVLALLVITAAVAIWVSIAYSYNSGLIYIAICLIASLVYIFNKSMTLILTILFFFVYAMLWIFVNGDSGLAAPFLCFGIGAIMIVGMVTVADNRRGK